MKTTRIISINHINPSYATIIRSYCYLLKQQLLDNWVSDNSEQSSDIVIVYDNFQGTFDSKTKAIIIIGNKENKTFLSTKNSIEIYINKINNSHKFVEILNKISNSIGNTESTTNPSKHIFSFKNIFGRLMFRKNKTEQKNTNKNKATPVTDKLLKLSNPNINNCLKVVFLGRPGSGKTTAITSAKSTNLISCEVNATDSIGLLKQKTTIGIDYSECNFNNGIKLKLFGTPGQGRYDYLQLQTIKQSDICIILIDMTSVNLFQEFEYYYSILKSESTIQNSMKVVAYTHLDTCNIEKKELKNLSDKIKNFCENQIVITRTNPTNRANVRALLKTLAEIKISKNTAKSLN